MLGQPVSMLIPRVVGFKLTGAIPAGATATDVVLTITEMLRKHGVVGKFVEFYGEGVAAVPLANRATIGNMSPEFGSTCAIFPIDDVTLRLPAPHRPLRRAGRARRGVRQGAGPVARRRPDRARVPLQRVPRARPVHGRAVDRRPEAPAGPDRRRPRPRRRSARSCPPTSTHHEGDAGVGSSFPASDPSPQGSTDGTNGGDKPADEGDGNGRPSRKVSVTTPEGATFEIDHGAVSIASITSCTNTSNPSVMIGAALLAKNAVEQGPVRQAVGQDVDGARLEGRHRLLREGRPVALPREARLPPRRLRLHHLHRQLRPAARGDLGGGQRERPRRRLGALGQPQLRGPDQPGREDELPRVARRSSSPTRWPGTMDFDFDDRAAGSGHRRATTSSSRTSGRRRPRSSATIDAVASARRCSPRDYADVFAGDERWQSLPTPGGRHLRLGRRLDLRAQAPVLRRHAARAVAGHRHRRRPGAGQAR